MRIGAAATALGVSTDTLRRWERDGRVAFVRRGGQRFLPADELAAMLRALVRTPSPDRARSIAASSSAGRKR